MKTAEWREANSERWKAFQRPAEGERDVVVIGVLASIGLMAAARQPKPAPNRVRWALGGPEIGALTDTQRQLNGEIAGSERSKSGNVGAVGAGSTD